MYAGQNIHSISAAFSDGERDAKAQVRKGCGVGLQLVGSQERLPLLEAGVGFGGGKRHLAGGHLRLFLYLEQGAIQINGIDEFGVPLAALPQSLGDLCVADHDPLSVHQTYR